MGKLPDNSEARDRLIDEIENIESVRTGVKKPKVDRVVLNEMTYTPPTDEYLKVKAERDLADYKSKSENAIKSASAANAEMLNKNRAEYASARDNEIAELGALYADASDAVDADVLRRGLARSTVATNAKSELATDYADRSAAVLREYGDKMSAVDAEISAVGKKLDAALNDFNLSYAAKLAEKLDELKAEREKKTAEVVEYNNSVREKQAKLDLDRAQTESKLYSDALAQHQKETALDNLSPEARNEIYKSVYGKMDEFLSSLSPQQARLEFLNHTIYREHLSDYYYYKLYDKYGR